MKLNPYLNFNGQCEAAFAFYEQVLGGKMASKMTWGEFPEGEIPPESRKLVMHAALQIGDEWLMGADSLAHDYEQPKGIQVALHYKDTAEGERIFNALAENGNVVMPFQKTFWAAGFGMCVDRFGIPWMVNCEQAS
jgi:PhnB protein